MTLIKNHLSIQLLPSRLELNYEFDWENPTIVDKEKFYYRRLTSEMIHIKLQNNLLNLQSDTECLHYAYIDI